MNYVTRLIWGMFLFLIGQVLVWYQVNGQFLSDWIKDRPWLMALCGIPISYTYIWATHHLVIAFNGELWPQRLIGFSMGMISFAFLTWFHLNEALTTKTAVTLALAFTIVLIQIFWK